MSKLEENKKKKKDALFSTAFELFTTKGINKTAISDIVEKAGVAKGTFYLYFTDKYDIRNKLVSHKATELFASDEEAMEHAEGVCSFEDKMIFIIDHIIDELNSNKSLLGFISKNLGWGVFKSALHLPPEDDGPDFYSKYLATVKADQTQYQDPEVMLFTIIELTSSTCFNSILHGEPLSIEEYKPHLYRSIRAIIREYAVK